VAIGAIAVAVDECSPLARSQSQVATPADAVGGPTFPTEIQPKAVALTGIQLAGDQCDACMLIAAHCVGCTLEAGEPAAWYMVTQGTLTITDASMPNIGGKLSNAKFEHVNVATNGATTPVGDGCTSAIASITFATTVTNVQ
jgi:hypothetical protein